MSAFVFLKICFLFLFPKPNELMPTVSRYITSTICCIWQKIVRIYEKENEINCSVHFRDSCFRNNSKLVFAKIKLNDTKYEYEMVNFCKVQHFYEKSVKSEDLNIGITQCSFTQLIPITQCSFSKVNYYQSETAL